MVPKKDRASGGAAIGVANSGLARRPLVFLLVVASILINWNYPLSISIQIHIFIYTHIHIYIYIYIHIHI